MRRSMLTIFTTGLTLLGVAAPAVAGPLDYGQVNYFSTNAMPSNKDTNDIESVPDPITCYEVGTGILLDCPFTYQILGLASVLPSLGYQDSGYPQYLINGGHTHDADRPFVYPATGSGGLTLTSGTLVSVEPQSITGKTNSVVAAVKYQMPETGGLIAVQIEVGFPTGYHCVGYCWDPGHARDIEFFRVGHFLYGHSDTMFDRLPKAGENYEIIDTSNGHTDGTYALGTYLAPSAEMRLLAIASKYKFYAASGLSLNDMSLPVGGLLDIHDNWKTPHHLHRHGTSADVNRRNLAGTLNECTADLDLRRAVEDNLGANLPGQWDKLLCEPVNDASGNPVIDSDGNPQENKHINLFPPSLDIVQ